MYHFLYLIQSGDDLYTNIYKIGKTIKLPEQRFKGYDKGLYPLRISLVDDCHIRENELIEIFNNKFKLAKGREYFEGNVKDMIDEFSKFCDQSEIYDKIQNNKLENGLLDIINSNMTIDKKILMIKILNNNLITENIIEILNSELSNDTKILLLIN